MPSQPARQELHGALKPLAPVRSVLFHRDFRQFSGGHLKVWHYFNHVRSSPDYDAWVRFSATTVWDHTNPWHSCGDRVLAPGARAAPDVLFLAGLDWMQLKRRKRHRSRRPVVNLIQHVRHADPTDPRFAFLSHRAVRICVSTEVEEAIVATGRVNGPVLTVPNAVDISSRSEPLHPARRDIDVLVVANKQPAQGAALAGRLQHMQSSVHLVDELVPRRDFLDLLARSRVTAFLPNPTEGFYLPALEGMALGTLVVCPDCVGNRSFCIPNENCLRPSHDMDSLLAAVQAALASSPAQSEAMRHRAAATAAVHDLSAERAAVLAILEKVDQLYGPHRAWG